MKNASRLSCSPLLASVIGGAAVPIAVLALVVTGFLSEPSMGEPFTPVQLLVHPIVAIMAGVAAGISVWLGLFGARSERLGAGRVFLIPVLFLPVVALVATLWSIYVQNLPPGSASGGSVAFQHLGLLWSLSLPLIAVTSFFVARASRTRARGV